MGENMKKGWKIFLTVFLCIVLIVGVVVYLNWNTIMGVVDGVRYTQEDVEIKQEENRKELQKFLDENKGVTVRELTAEESKALADGDISEEDAVQIITGSTTLDEIKVQKESKEEPSESIVESTTTVTIADIEDTSNSFDDGEFLEHKTENSETEIKTKN